jgi:beta-galactosidase
MHAGLNLPGLHELSAGGLEAATAGGELEAVGSLPATIKATVAIVYDYEAAWVTKIQPQGADFRFFELAFRWYEAIRRLGLNVDFVAPGMALDDYALVLVPSLPIVSEATEQAFANASGVVLYGPRTGSKTRHFGIPSQLPPGPLAARLKVRVLEVASLRPGLSYAVTGAVSGNAIRWRENIDGTSRVIAKFADGSAALTESGRQYYLACWPDSKLLESVTAFVARQAGLAVVELPAAIRLRRRGNLTFAFNYGDEAWEAPVDGTLLLGTQKVAAQGVSLWRCAISA